MSHTLFGWSYPPGCAGPPDDDRLCALCDDDSATCTCPTCGVCGEQGNPDCYDTEGHGLDETPRQAQVRQAQEAQRMRVEFFIRRTDDKRTISRLGDHQGKNDATQ